MVHEALAGALALPDGHLQGVQGEIGAQMAGRLPADDEAAEDVEDERDVDEAGPGTDIREVGDPETVRGGRREVALDEVVGSRGGLVRLRREHLLAAHDAAQAF